MVPAAARLPSFLTLERPGPLLHSVSLRWGLSEFCPWPDPGYACGARAFEPRCEASLRGSPEDMRDAGVAPSSSSERLLRAHARPCAPASSVSKLTLSACERYRSPGERLAGSPNSLCFAVFSPLMSHPLLLTCKKLSVVFAKR